MWNPATSSCETESAGNQLFHFVLNDCVALDNRIPPKGITGGDDLQTHPVGYVYPEASPGSGVLVNQDVTSYSIPVPPTAVTPITVTATLSDLQQGVRRLPGRPSRHARLPERLPAAHHGTAGKEPGACPPRSVECLRPLAAGRRHPPSLVPGEAGEGSAQARAGARTGPADDFGSHALDAAADDELCLPATIAP